MLRALIAFSALTAMVAAWAGRAYLRERSRRKMSGWLRPWPIPQVALEQFDPIFAPDELGTTRETEVRFISAGDRGTPGGTSDLETWVLSVLARRATMLFEFGTCTGRTAYLWACNAREDARVFTLTLPADGVGAYRAENGDEPSAREDALAESRFTRFLYAGTPEAAKITQLYGDSKEFDESPYLEGMDLIFVDGSHAASYCASDTAKALRMLRPGGIILWHDYRGPRATPGVFSTLNRAGRELTLVHLKGTSLVA